MTAPPPDVQTGPQLNVPTGSGPVAKISKHSRHLTLKAHGAGFRERTLKPLSPSAIQLLLIGGASNSTKTMTGCGGAIGVYMGAKAVRHLIIGQLMKRRGPWLLA